MSERKTVTITGATALVGVSRRTMYNWMKAGKVEFIRTASGTRRIFVDTLWQGGAPLAKESSPC